MISARTRSDLNAILQSGNMDLAGAIAEEAISRGESDEILFTLAGQLRRQSGDYHNAVALFQRAVELAPYNPDVLTNAGDAMRYTGQLSEAIALFDRAIACAPTTVSAWYGRALACEAEGALDAAQLSYAKVTEFAPNMASGFAALGLVQIRNGNIGEARKNISHAQMLAPDEYVTMMAVVQSEIEDKNYQNAIDWLRKLLKSAIMPAENEILLHQLLRNTLEKIDLFEEAYESYRLSNERFAQIHADHNERPIALHAVQAIDAGVRSLGKSQFAPCAASGSKEAAGHIFLLGYPRSGTTLVEQIIATIPGIVALEETQTFADSEKYLTTDGLVAFSELNNSQIEKLRASYWNIVANSGVDIKDKTFVDMDPLKGSALPLIARMFSDAKIVIMHRDPRDIIWSCYKHNFIYSPITYEFTSIQRTAKHFVALMNFMKFCLENMKLSIYILSYEEIIRDFDKTTHGLCDFLDLPWSPDLRNFGKTARGRTIRTASASQVRQPLFDGTGQWRRYADYIEPVMSIIQPWIDPSHLLSGRE
jgi:Tfp pilus assembly protein PilF